MDKEPLLPQADHRMQRRPSPKRFSRFHTAAAAAAVILFAVFWLARAWDCGHHEEKAGAKVPLEVHIM